MFSNFNSLALTLTRKLAFVHISFVRNISDSVLLNNINKFVVKRVSIQDPRASSVIKAVREKDFIKVRKLKESGVSLDAHTFNENTPLTDAAKRGDLNGVSMLIKMGANPYASCDCRSHNTAFHYASKYGNLNIVEYFLANNINPNVLNSDSKTALDVASDKKCIEIIKKNGGRNGTNGEFTDKTIVMFRKNSNIKTIGS